MHLIGKDFLTVYAVGVSNGVLRSHAQDMVLGRSVYRSPRTIFPFQVDNALLFTGFAGIGNVRTLRNVQLGIKLLHIFVEGIDLHFAVVSAMYNAERVVDQTEGLAAVAGFVVGADDLYRIVVQQFLDVFLAGLGGLNLSPLGRQRHIRGGHGKLAVLKSRLTLLGRGNFPTLEVIATFLRFIAGNRNRDVFRVVSVFYRLPGFPASAIQFITDRIELRPLGRQLHVL